MPTKSMVPLALLLPATLLAACGRQPCVVAPREPFVSVTLAPRATDGAVPTNALLWRLSSNEASASVVVGQEPSLVDLDRGATGIERVGTWSGAGVVLEAWRPAGGLLPGAEYEWTTGTPDSTANPEVTTSFHAGQEEDLDPPEAPAGVQVAAWSGGPSWDVCAPDDGALHETVLATTTPQPWIVAVGQDLLVDDGMPTEDQIDGATQQSELWIRSFWPLSTHHVRLFNVDLAGNWSPASESVPVTMPAAGCGEVSGGSAVILLALPLKLGVRRRRHRRGTRGPGFLLLTLALLLPGMWPQPALADSPADDESEQERRERAARRRWRERPGPPEPGLKVAPPRNASREERVRAFAGVAWRQEGLRKLRASRVPFLLAGVGSTAGVGAGALAAAGAQPAALQVLTVSVAGTIATGINLAIQEDLARQLRQWRWNRLRRAWPEAGGALLAGGAGAFAGSIGFLASGEFRWVALPVMTAGAVLTYLGAFISIVSRLILPGGLETPPPISVLPGPGGFTVLF